MSVRVDEPRHENRVGTVEVLARLELFLDFGSWADCNDALAADGNGAVFDETARGIHGHDVSGGVDGVGIFAEQGEGKDTGQETCATRETKHRRASETGLSSRTFRSCRADSRVSLQRCRRIPKESGGRRRRAV